jgi:hypothetical protein
MKQLLTIMFFLPILSLSQIECPKQSKDYAGVGGVYLGCLNSYGERDGFGSMSYDNGDNYQGEWENDVFVRGNAKITQIMTESYSGEKTRATILLEGGFKKTNYSRYFWELHGVDCVQEISYGNKTTIKQELYVGVFKNGELFTGTHTQFYKDGRELTRVVDSGNVVSQIDNLENKYVAEDVGCKLNRNIVDLTRKDRKYVVDLSFVVGDVGFIFDTGAMDLMIGRDDFNKIKKGGGFQELDVDMECQGVFSGGNCKRVIFEEINIGDCAIYNVAATIGLNSDFSLVGIGFFDKFGNVQWDMQKKQLILTRDR